MLTYCAGMVAAIATFLAVYLTSEHDRKARREDSRLSVIPCISPTEVHRRAYPHGLMDCEEYSAHSYDELLRDVFGRKERPHAIVAEKNGGLRYCNSLKKDELDELKRVLEIGIGSREMASLQAAVGNYFFFDFLSHGNGAAVNACFKIEENEDKEKKSRTTEPITLPVGDRYSILILFMSEERLRAGGRLVLAYDDVLGNRYEQVYLYGIRALPYADAPDDEERVFFKLKLDRRLVLPAGKA